MIEDQKMLELFPVDFSRIVLNLDHDAINNYCIEFVKGIDNYTTYHDLETNDKWMQGLDELRLLEEDITEACKVWCNNTGRRFTNPCLVMWASVYNDGKGHGAHIHRRSLVSGTYYPAGDKEHSSIQFESPWLPYGMHDNIDEKRLRKAFKPKKGDMYLWPSFVQHRVWEQNTCPNPRVAISFNMDDR